MSVCVCVYMYVCDGYYMFMTSCIFTYTNSSFLLSQPTRSSPIIDSDDEDDQNEGEEWIFPVPEKKSEQLRMFSCLRVSNASYQN